jgi:hypothetical protein
MHYINTISDFLQANQALLISVLFIGAYFLKRLVDYKAAQPQHDIWDEVKPGSDALYALIHKGVEYYAKSKGLASAGKLLEYAKIADQFDANWKVDRNKAVRELAAWFLSMKAKQVAPNPFGLVPELTADTPAQE